ncbi:MAG: branched-chain amino acid ABC transporter permease [Actinomycetota bacterium]
MNLDFLDAFLISGSFGVVEIIGLGLLLHLQLGLTKVANFGIVGFWGLGLYTFGVLYVQVDWPFGDPWQFFFSTLGAMIMSGLAGLLVGWLISDLDSDGAMVGTLGFASIVLILGTNLDGLTGGALGLGGLGFPYDIGSIKANELLWLGIMTVVVALILLYVRWVHRTPYGRLLIAVGSNEPLARSMGKSTTRAKLILFSTTSALMGLLGAMHGVNVRFLEIGSLDVGVTLAALAGLILGGTARVWGAVVGVLLTVGLFDILIQFYIPLPQEWYTQAVPVAREAVFGALLVLVLLFRPDGVLGRMRRPQLMRNLHDFG